MKTKDVLLVVGGIALGYYASKMNWGKNTATAVGDVVNGATGVADGLVTDVKDIAVGVNTTLICENNWVKEVGSLSRFASNEAMEKSKSEYIKKCMASK